MKRSIRTTFIGLFIGLLAMVLLAVWAMNSFFLENYYLNDKVKILQDTYTQINAYAMEKAAAGEDIMDDLQSLYSKDGEQNEITRLIRNVNEKYNITVVIVDSTNDEPVHRGVAFMGLADFVVDAGIEENTLGSRRLTRINVRHDADVSGFFK